MQRVVKLIKVQDYKRLILQEKFFEAHEVLEEFWFPRRREKDDTTLIVKGFINAAVAFELKKRGREEKALMVWKTYKKFAKKISVEDEEFLLLKGFIDNYANSYLL